MANQRIPAARAGWLLRAVFSMIGRELGKLTWKAETPAPLRVLAHRPRLLFGQLMMESAQSAATTVPARLKSLALVAAATSIGCPF